MKIYVRRRHIERGKRDKSHLCPVALALKAATGKSAGVGIAYIDMTDGVFKTPSTVQRFIARFDAGKPVKPFAFVLK